LLLFQALRFGPAYLVFPIISLYPVVTVLLAYTFLKERARIDQVVAGLPISDKLLQAVDLREATVE